MVSQSSPGLVAAPSMAPPVACHCRLCSMRSRTVHSLQGVWVSRSASSTRAYTSVHLSATGRQMSIGPLTVGPLASGDAYGSDYRAWAHPAQANAGMLRSLLQFLCRPLRTYDADSVRPWRPYDRQGL